jgi:DNA-binding transcriptional ArsR family regulator
MQQTAPVTDIRSNPNDQIAHAAGVLKTSIQRKAVFGEICRGKKKSKTVYEIAEATGLSKIRVLQEGKRLVNNGIVKQIKDQGETGYEKDPFFSLHKKKILSLAGNRRNLEKFPTKTNPRIVVAKNEIVRLPRKFIDARMITIEDIDSFKRVRNVISNSDVAPRPILESKFKHGVQRIIGENGIFKDWGGEKNDLYTTRLRIKGKRMFAAFGFKGRGKRGKLTPAKMGKNGDQIQRLFNASAQVFIIQYWNQIDESVVELMHALAKAKSASDGSTIFFGIMDGRDSALLMRSYPHCFSRR